MWEIDIIHENIDAVYRKPICNDCELICNLYNFQYDAYYGRYQSAFIAEKVHNIPVDVAIPFIGKSECPWIIPSEYVIFFYQITCGLLNTWPTNDILKSIYVRQPSNEYEYINFHMKHVKWKPWVVSHDGHWRVSYLGAIFSNQKDRVRENYENKRGKVLRAIYNSINLVHSAIGPDVSPNVLFKIFDTQIQPIINYASEVFYDRKTKPR